MKDFIVKMVMNILIFLSFFYFPYGMVNADIQVLNETSSGFSLSYRPSVSSRDTISYSDKKYIHFSYENHLTKLLVGAPAIPSKSVFFASPKGVVPAIELVNISKSEIADILIIPVPYIENDKEGFSREVYKEDPA